MSKGCDLCSGRAQDGTHIYYKLYYNNVIIVIFQSKTSGSGDIHVEKAQCERSEHEVGTEGVGQTRASCRMRGPRVPDHLPRSAGARRVHGPEPDQASTGGLPEGVGKAFHHGGHVQPTRLDRP